MAMVIFRVAPEQFQNVLHAELADRFALDGRLGEGPFFLLKGQDALFDRVGDGQSVDDDVDRLIEPMDTVDGLFFDELCC